MAVNIKVFGQYVSETRYGYDPIIYTIWTSPKGHLFVREEVAVREFYGRVSKRDFFGFNVKLFL